MVQVNQNFLEAAFKLSFLLNLSCSYSPLMQVRWVEECNPYLSWIIRMKMSSAFLFSVEENREEREKLGGSYIWQVDVKMLDTNESSRWIKRISMLLSIFFKTRNWQKAYFSKKASYIHIYIYTQYIYIYVQPYV